MINNLQLITKIKENEDAYLQNFCNKDDHGQFIRYRDEKLQDMYDYNCTLVKHCEDAEQLSAIIENEIETCKSQGRNFCRLYFEDRPQFNLQHENVAIEHNGFYVYNKENIPSWNILDNCVIKQIDTNEMVDELIAGSIINDGDNCTKEFCIRKASHHGQVYLDKKKLLNCYICYYNNIPVAHCELMIKDNVAKIEDFIVQEKFQRKGIGSTIMKYLLNKTMNLTDIIYLVADEDDTPKEMYIDMGFKKVGDRYGALLNL